jgi:hypothetical protein
MTPIGTEFPEKDERVVSTRLDEGKHLTPLLITSYVRES